MTTRIERWGMELAESIRREHELTEELTAVKAEIDETIAKIRQEGKSALYESTSETTLVRPFIPTVGAEDPAATVRIERPVSLDDTLINLVTPRPEQDNTRALPSLVPCLGMRWGTAADCPSAPHTHVGAQIRWLPA